MATQILIGGAAVLTFMYAMARTSVVESEFYANQTAQEQEEMPPSKWPYVHMGDVLESVNYKSFHHNIDSVAAHQTYLRHNGALAPSGLGQQQVMYQNMVNNM